MKFKSVRVFALVMAMTVAIVGCDSANPSRQPGSGPAVIRQNTPTVMPQEIRRSDGGRTFLLAEGWAIPPLAAAEREEFETSITTVDGRSIKVHRTVIRTDPLSLYTSNPLHLIGMGSKDIRINKVKEYRTSAGIFCYRFLVNDAYVDESTNEVHSTRVLYPYSYYDENGDGVFESLVVSEKDRNGRQGFESEPHLPEWAIGKNL